MVLPVVSARSAPVTVDPVPVDVVALLGVDAVVESGAVPTLLPMVMPCPSVPRPVLSLDTLPYQACPKYVARTSGSNRAGHSSSGIDASNTP